MAKIAVVGRRENVLCYLAAGFAVYPAENADDARTMLDRAASEGAQIVFVSTEYADALKEDIAEYAFLPTPAVTLLPKKCEGMDPGSILMKRAVERAVGADIIYRD